MCPAVISVPPRRCINEIATAEPTFDTQYLVIPISHPPSEARPLIKVKPGGNGAVLPRGGIYSPNTDPLLKSISSAGSVPNSQNVHNVRVYPRDSAFIGRERFSSAFNTIT